MITTKSMVKEIKSQQEDFADRFEEFIVEQQKNTEFFQKQIAIISERMDCLEKRNFENQERNINNYSEIVRLIEAINVLQNNMSSEFEIGTKEACEKIISLTRKDAKTMLDIMQETLDRSAQQCENNFGMVSDELKSIRLAIYEMEGLKEKQDKLVSRNIETMSIAMQEMLRELLALDEGNRLIIAKLLLKDVDI